MARPTPAAEVDVTVDLVRSLVDSQFPRFGDLELTLAGNGWDNAMYRLGDDLAVRLPRRQLAAPLILNEQLCLPILAPRLPIEVPTLVGSGQPEGSYPWHWSVLQWIDGKPVASVPLGEGQGKRLAEFLLALHQPAHADAPVNSHRGGPLEDRGDVTARYLDSVSDDAQMAQALGLDLDRIRSVWAQLASTPGHDGPAVWLHGDLHPLNMLATDGELCGIIDFGDVTSGDPATDIACCFAALTAEERLVFRQTLGCDEDTWNRARGWALSVGLAFMAFGADNPTMTAIGSKAINAVLDSSK